MGVTQAEKEMLSRFPKHERRKQERRKNVEAAKQWKGMERRMFERRSFDVLNSFEKT